MGRKPQYNYTDKEFLLSIESMARDGLDEAQIAEQIGVHRSYFCELKNKYPELDNAVKRGRKPLDIIVEDSLYKRAIGLKVKKITRKWVVAPDGTQSDAEIILEEETELPPDTGAAMAWLKHRKPEQWNLASKLDLTTKNESLNNNKTTPAELAQLVKELNGMVKSK